MTVTEFCGDPIFDAAARYWPEREHGWQGRLSDLLDAVRDSLAADVKADMLDKDEVDDVLSALRDAVDEVDSAASSLRRFVRDRMKEKAAAA